MPTTNISNRRADHETLDGVQMRHALRGQLMVGVGRLSDLLVDRIEEGIDLLLMHRARAGEVVGINEGKEVIGEQHVVGLVSPAPCVTKARSLLSPSTAMVCKRALSFSSLRRNSVRAAASG